MGKSRFPKPDQTFTQDLSAAALSETTSTNGKAFNLDQIYITFRTAGNLTAVSETITITLDSVHGSNYDGIPQEVVLVSESSFTYRPQGDPIFNAGDEIKIECTNDTATCIVYVTVKTSEIN